MDRDMRVGRGKMDAYGGHTDLGETDKDGLAWWGERVERDDGGGD